MASLSALREVYQQALLEEGRKLGVVDELESGIS